MRTLLLTSQVGCECGDSMRKLQEAALWLNTSYPTLPTHYDWSQMGGKLVCLCLRKGQGGWEGWGESGDGKNKQKLNLFSAGHFRAHFFKVFSWSSADLSLAVSKPPNHTPFALSGNLEWFSERRGFSESRLAKVMGLLGSSCLVAPNLRFKKGATWLALRPRRQSGRW